MLSKVLKSYLVYAVILATVLGSQIALAGVSAVSASSDATNLYYRFNYTDAPQFFRLFLDTDSTSSTGYPSNGLGAEYMVENSNLYKYSGSNGSWSWMTVKAVTTTQTSTTISWTIAKTLVGSPANLKFHVQSSSPVSNSVVSSQTIVSTLSPSVSLAVQGAPNLPLNGTSTLVTVGLINGTPTKVELSRDGGAAFATWPSGTFFTLASDGKSLVGQWCITSSCWGGVSGTHVLNVLVTYSNGSTRSASVTLNVSNSSTTTLPPASTPTTTTLPPPPPASTTTTTVRVTTTTTTVPAPTTTTTLPVSTGPIYYLSPSGNDANVGTQSAPWRTIQKAANTVSAGATVILMDGSYEEPEIAMKRSGTASAPITFQAQHKWLAIVSSVSGCQPGISLYASYITLKDLRLSVSSRNANCTIYTSANVHVRAWNSVNPTPSNPTTGYAGFHAIGLKADNANRSEGLKSNQDFTMIENSEIAHSLELFGSLNSVIRNNIITGQGGSSVSIFAKGGVRNAQIYGNTIHNKASNANGIIIGGFSCDTCHFDTSTNIEAYNSVAYNNVIINESSGQMAGLTFQGAKDSAFYNNVVINGMISMLLGGHNSGPQAPVTNPTFKNNIVLCNGASVTSGYFGWSNSGTLSVDYNDFYNCSGAPAQAHTISGNPMFVNQLSDWHLQSGSAAINAGTPVTMPAYGGGTIDISRDKDGVIRSAPWDLGIYNVTP
jgi:hypothetical protein